MKTYRAAAHVHSTWSYDGEWTLDALARAFARRRYRVVLSSEHDRGFSNARLEEYRAACSKASSDAILVVPGIEYSDATNTVHVLVWGRLPFLGEGMPTGQLLTKVTELGGSAVLAHPWRKDAWMHIDESWIEHLAGIEMWNRKSDGWAPEPRALATARPLSLMPFASLDFHRRRQFFPLRMRLQVEGDLCEESVLQTLRAHRCHPTAFGVDARIFASGAGLCLARSADHGRRGALRVIRRRRLRRSGGRTPTA
jgi:hypothetical protein